MTWYVLLYNNVQDKVIEAYDLEDNAPVPEEVFFKLKLNGELTGYYLALARNDQPKRWGVHNMVKGMWLTPTSLPDTVKMWGMMLT